MGKNGLYRVDFRIDDLSLREQDRIFRELLKQLDTDARLKLHVTVTDFLGGKHHIWDRTGEDPNGVKCKECNAIDCETCPTYNARESVRNGKSDDNAGNDTRNK